MAFEILKAVLKLEGLPGLEKSLAVHLADFTNSKTGEAWPCLATLARLTGFTQNSVRRGLRALVERGVIEVVREPTPRKPAVYIFNQPILGSNGERSNGERSNGVREGYHGVREGYHGVREGYHGGTRSIKDPQKEPLINPCEEKEKSDYEICLGENIEASDVFARLPAKDGKWVLTKPRFKELCGEFPGVDVLEVLRKFRMWLLELPEIKIRMGGMERNLLDWLSKASANTNTRERDEFYDDEDDADAPPTMLDVYKEQARLRRVSWWDFRWKDRYTGEITYPLRALVENPPGDDNQKGSN